MTVEELIERRDRTLEFEETHTPLVVRNSPSRNCIFWGDPQGQLTHIENVWKPDGILRVALALRKRPFVMPCRALCGMDLKRVHVTCLTCRIRKAYYGLIPNRREVVAVTLLVHNPGRMSGRDIVRLAILKKILTIAEFFVG